MKFGKFTNYIRQIHSKNLKTQNKNWILYTE